MNRNIELKARLEDIDKAHEIARSLGVVPHELERQRDTYFPVRTGRLKLRERWPIDSPQPEFSDLPPPDSNLAKPSQLIWYYRSNEARARPSDYSLVEVPPVDTLRDLLVGALGVEVCVIKHRTIYLYQNVRIHLDQVVHLGTFLEFEAIVDANCDEIAAESKVRDLRSLFKVSNDAICSVSYSDLLRAST